MANIDETQYELVPFTVYNTLESKLNALMSGEVLFFKGFDIRQGRDVLVRFKYNEEHGAMLAQISYDTYSNKPVSPTDSLIDDEEVIVDDSYTVDNTEQLNEGDSLTELKKGILGIDITEEEVIKEADSKYWITTEVGINQLSMTTAIKFDKFFYGLKNKYHIGDTVYYKSIDGREDSALILEVYALKVEPSTTPSMLDKSKVKYAYRLSRDNGLYEESELYEYRR